MENIIKLKHGVRYSCEHNNIWTTFTNNSNNNNQERKMPGTRSGSNGSGLTPEQRAAVLAAFGGDQAVALRMIGIMEGTAAIQAAPVPQDPVYDANHATFKHQFQKNGNTHTLNLMSTQQWTGFLKNVLKLSNAQIAELKIEGLEYPEDFAVFDSDTIDATIKSMRSKHLSLGGITSLRLKQFCDFMQYLQNVDRKLRYGMLNAETIKHYADSFDAIKEKTKDGKLTVLKKNGDMLLWLDDVDKDLKGYVGNRGISLAYLNIDKKAPDANTDDTLWDFEKGKCYSKEHGSLKQELIHRSTQDHPNTNDDNNLLYRLLDAATKGTQYHSTLDKFSEDEDGQSAYDALYDQHGGNAKWEKAYETMESSIKSRKWKSTGHVTMNEHCAFHRDMHSRMEKAATHIQVTVPNNRQRVLMLLSSIDSQHTDISAHVSTIKGDPNGMGADFELTAEHLLRADPVEKNKAKSKNRTGGPSISATLGGKGPKTGVEYRWYQGNEFSKLSEAQQDELRAWRSSAKGKAHIQKAKEEYQSKKRKAGGKGNGNEQQGRWNRQKTVHEAKKMIAAAMKTAEEENTASGDKDKTIAELSSTVASLREENKEKAAAASVTFSPQTEAEQRKAMCAQLSSIVGRAGRKKKDNQ